MSIYKSKEQYGFKTSLFISPKAAIVQIHPSITEF